MTALAEAAGPLALILSRVKQARKSSSGWTACCPAHDDRTPSLSITEGHEGRVLVTCHVGCDFPAIAAGMGLERKDFFSEPANVLPFRPPTRAPSHRASGRIVQTYPYCDENGILLYETVRYEPKDFKQRQPDGHGGWAWKLGDVQRVLYRLSETIEAAAMDRRIYVTEGEKDADRLVAHGLSATTNARGAKEWRQEYSEALQGASVVILEDNDQAGRDRTRRVAESLTHNGCTVRVLRLPNLPPKGDVSGWLDAGGTVDALEALADAAPVWPEGEPFPGDVGGDVDEPELHESISEPNDEHVRRFRLFSDLELEAQPAGRPLVEGVAYQNGLISLIGKYGTYKTFILLELAFCIAVGADWHGRRVTPGAVVYVYAEGAHGIKKRLAACKRAYGYTGGAGIYFLPTSVLVSDPAQVAAFLLAIGELPVDSIAAVFIDTVARNMAGNENTVDDMGKFVRGCDTIREHLKCAVFLAHHTGWEAERSRGSTNLPASVDTEIMVDRDDTIVTLRCTKQKEAAEFSPITLEAFPIAESLALRAVGAHRAELTKNERAALNALQTSGAAKSNEWREATELANGSFQNARKRLHDLAYVKVARSLYTVTEAGSQALGPNSNRSTSPLQSALSDRSNQSPRSRDRGVGLGDQLLTADEDV
jgi:hypothetical protein